MRCALSVRLGSTGGRSLVTREAHRSSCPRAVWPTFIIPPRESYGLVVLIEGVRRWSVEASLLHGDKGEINVQPWVRAITLCDQSSHA
jgi:hypothetical protein